jgi:hypothetical protein
VRRFKIIKDILDKIAGGLGSKRFYYCMLAFFVIESAWIAISALYPQAFDENFHYGLIKVYSHYWLPFFSNQPPHADAYGAVARDPSYLYHYLMSFPYRFIALFVHGQSGQVIWLRFINIAMFGGGLVLFKRLLRRVGVSRSLSNVSILLFVLIPIVPQLAAQINYDDMLFPLVAWVCLQAFDIIDDIKARKLSSKRILILLITCFFTTLVKYAFLPIFAAIVIFLAVLIYRGYKGKFGKLFMQLKTDFLKNSRLVKIGLPLLLVISLGMCLQRDGVNLVKYHSVEPDCSKVLTIKQCSAYSPWYYNYQNHTNVVSGKYVASDSVLTYTQKWFYWMWYRLFFAVNGQASNFANDPPLPLPSIAAAVLAVVSLLALIKARHTLFHKRPYLTLMLAVCLIYGLTLFVQGYTTYRYTAILENMNGRYLLPILLPLASVIGIAMSSVIGKSKAVKSFLVVIVLVLFLDGGGIFTFLFNSDSTWYWNNSTVQKVNSGAKTITKHVVVKKKDNSR